MVVLLLVVAIVVIGGGAAVAMMMKSKGGSDADNARAASSAQRDLVSIEERLAPGPAAKAPVAKSAPSPEAPLGTPAALVSDGAAQARAKARAVSAGSPVPTPSRPTAVPAPSPLATSPAGIASSAVDKPEEPTFESAPDPIAADVADVPDSDPDDEPTAEDEDFDRFGTPGTRARMADDLLLSTPMAELAGSASKVAAVEPVAFPADERSAAESLAAESLAAETLAAVDLESSASSIDDAHHDTSDVEEIEATDPIVAEASDFEASAIESPQIEIVEIGENPTFAAEESPTPDDGDPGTSVMQAVAEAPVVAEPVVVEPVVVEPVVEAPVSDGEIPVLQAEPPARVDPVDHVLHALINRAKERKVGIAQVAAELIDQANLEDKEVDEVLAELVGITGGTDATSTSGKLTELTLFNDSVPRRPGQLLDFANLGPQEKKLALVRVLCLLVALQEEEQLDPRPADPDTGARSWPLARAVWPTKSQGSDEPDENLPARAKRKRLARQR